MKISHKVPLIATTIIVAAFAIFSFFQYTVIKEEIYEQTDNQISEVSYTLGQEITNWLNERLAIVDGISDYIAADFSRQKVIEAMSPKRFNDDFTLFFGALDIDGKPISNKKDYNPKGWDGRERPWWAVAKRNKRAVMTAPYVGHTTQKLLISAVANIYDGENSVGAFGGDIELDTVANAVNTVNFNNTGYAFLIDEDGKIITHPTKGEYDKNYKSLFTGKIPTIQPKLQKTVSKGKNVLAGFYRLDKFLGSEKKWWVGVVVDEEKVLAPAKQLGINAIIAALIAALLSSAIFYLFMKSALINPVNNLAEQAIDISRGKLETEIESVSRTDEIGDLAIAVQRLQKSLRMAMTRIKKK